MKKIYSKVNTIPKGQASGRLIDGCLALEGGAFRGLYTQGFLDALMIQDINLSCVIGISAGALSGVNYVSGQIGRSGRINLTYRHDSHYVGLKALLHSHSPLDISFLIEERGNIKEKLDEERFYRPEQRFIAVTTNELTGETIYKKKGKCRLVPDDTARDQGIAGQKTFGSTVDADKRYWDCGNKANFINFNMAIILLLLFLL